MSDRKWLNLVIFLISVMIILFLMIHKNMNREIHTIQPTSFLLNQNFVPTMLRFNGRWIPVEQIQAEISSDQWSDFEKAWKTSLPIAILHQQQLLLENSLEYTLVWDDGNSKRNYKLIRSTDTLFLQSPQKTSEAYQFNAKQADLLLPLWLIDKARIE